MGVDRPSGRAAALASGWLPAGAVAVLATVVLREYGAPARTTAAFWAYLGLGLIVPGMLIWRAARMRSSSLIEDLAGGLVVGYAGEFLAYLPARAAGAPYLVVVWPIAVMLTFACVPRLRQFWRRDPTAARPPWWWSWLVAAACAFLVAWSAATFFRSHGLSGKGMSSPFVDMPYHLALAGELKHHVPPVVPFVTGEPLAYHWFVYADVAATSWVTGIEVQTLMYRLSVLPMMMAVAVLVAALATRLTGRWWAGPAAVAAAYLCTPPDPYPWANTPVNGASNLAVTWVSPTNAFGKAILVCLVLVLVDVLRPAADEAPRGARRLRWLIVIMLSVLAAGAKSSLLPVLLGGLLLVVAVHALVARRLHRRALAAAWIAASCLAFAIVVIFGGQPGAGRLVSPLEAVSTVAQGAGVTGDALPATAVQVALLAITIMAWGMTWAGVFGLRPTGARYDPAVILVAGVAVAGPLIALLTFFPGHGQAYFFQASSPFLAVLAVAGLAAVMPLGSRVAGWGVALAVLCGAAVLAAPTLGPGALVPALTDRAVGAQVAALLTPWILPVTALAVAGVVLFLVGRRLPAVRAAALAMVLAMAMGFGLPSIVRLISNVFVAAQHPWQPKIYADGLPAIPPDLVPAARWLRDHSDPDDLIATNAHCRTMPPCDNRHFSISAYAERRVLVEGWGYTARSIAESVREGIDFAHVAYDKPALLAANDAAFTTPSAATVNKLRDRYRVRWLVVEQRGATAPDLSPYATLRWHSAHYSIYELPR
jgi:hypothetical protein